MALPYDNTQIKQQLRPVPFTDESQPLYDASGNYVGHGAQGKVVTEREDPTAGGLKDVVTAGEQAIDNANAGAVTEQPAKQGEGTKATSNPQPTATKSAGDKPTAKPLSRVFTWGVHESNGNDGDFDPDPEANRTEEPVSIPRRKRTPRDKQGNTYNVTDNSTDLDKAGDDYDAASAGHSDVRRFEGPDIDPDSGEERAADNTKAKDSRPHANLLNTYVVQTDGRINKVVDVREVNGDVQIKYLDSDKWIDARYKDFIPDLNEAERVSKKRKDYRNGVTTPTPAPDADAANTSTGTDANRTPAKADRHQRNTLNKDGSVTPTNTTGTNENEANDKNTAANEQESDVKSFKGPNINPYTGTTGGDQTNAHLAVPDAPANSQASAPKDTSTQGDTDTEDPYAVTKEQYDAIKAKDPKDWTRQEALQVATYEHKPSAPADGGTYTPSQPPAYIAFNGNYNDAYKRMLDLMKANGDDPETKAKRAKARRAAKTIALLGDALAALANIWAASRGATSAKLSSASKAVADETNREEALALKRAEKYTKMLEDGRKADRDMEKIINARALAEWKELTRAGQKAHDSKTAGAWKEFEKRFGLYQARINQVNSHYDQLERQANQARLTDENNRKQYERRKALQDANNAAQVKLKQTPAAKSSGGSTQAL